MPRASAADAAATAVRILDSATELFAEHGFAAVSLDDVAIAAAVTRGAIYHHYRNKHGLLAAVASRLQAEVADHVVRHAETSEDPAEQLRQGCHGFLAGITRGPALRILLIDAPAALGWTHWRELDAESSVVLLREAVVAAGVHGELTDALTAQLSGAMNEAALWIAEQPDRDHASVLAHRSLDQLLDAVVPAEN